MRIVIVQFVVVALVAAGVLATPTRADAGFAAVEFTPAGAGGNAGDFVTGYQFQVTAPQVVSALGYYDHLGDGLAESHDVGLYTDAGTLLASVTVSNANALVGNFRYQSITPLLLSVGTYRVAGAGSVDLFVFNAPGLTSAPGISYLTPASSSGATLQFPLFLGGATDGFFGGNLLVDPVAAAVATPLPPTLLAGFLGMGLLAGVRRFRRA